MKKKRTKLMRILFSVAIAAAFVLSTAEAEARRKRKAPARSCAWNIARATNYFVPHVKDYCANGEVCQSFRKEVRMQGSGTLFGNKVLRYTGKTESLGDCNTARGARGTCLTPYVSIAADPRYHRMGDIIEMPHMKGKQITLPDGSKFSHPGYFIVEDTGGAIKGANRFDFFTGSHSWKNPANIFGAKGPKDTQKSDKNVCAETNRFAKLSPAKAQVALAELQGIINANRRVQLASTSNGRTGGGVQ